ncbi:MAG: RNB domain-containing ribonuclease [Bacilli bacterium]|nr:RNB domain-containing ribonuclease [Bacilli bacterium]
MGNITNDNELELKKILKQRTGYSFSKLKKIFNKKTDYDLMIFLIAFFNNSIEEINFEADVKNNDYFKELTRYYNYSLGKIELDNLKEKDDNSLFLVLHKLKELDINLQDKIRDNEMTNGTNNNLKNRILFSSIEERISDSIKNIENKIIKDYKIDTALSDDLENITKEIIFNLKNIDYVKVLFANFKEIVYLKDYNDRLIFTDVLSNYFNVLLNHNDQELENYFDQVVGLYLKTSEDDYLDNLFLIASDKFLDTVASNDDELRKTKINYLIAKHRSFIERGKEDLPFKESAFIETDDEKRLDLRDRFVITIDNDEAKLLENAISLEELDDDKYRLSIYTTDVLHFINSDDYYYKNSYNKALNEGRSKRIFKNKMKNKELSLDAGKDMPVFAYQFIIDNDFNLEYFDFKKATVNVNENIYYGDFAYLPESANEELKKTIDNLLYLIFDDLRLEDGINYQTANIINYITNSFALEVIKEYAQRKDLSLLFYENNYDCGEEVNKIKENKTNLDFLIEDIIRRDTSLRYLNSTSSKKENENVSLKVFSPVRNIDALVNQILIDKYLIDRKEITFEDQMYINDKLNLIVDNMNGNTKGNNDQKRKQRCSDESIQKKYQFRKRRN